MAIHAETYDCLFTLQRPGSGTTSSLLVVEVLERTSEAKGGKLLIQIGCSMPDATVDGNALVLRVNEGGSWDLTFAVHGRLEGVPAAPLTALTFAPSTTAIIICVLRRLQSSANTGCERTHWQSRLVHTFRVAAPQRLQGCGSGGARR